MNKILGEEQKEAQIKKSILYTFDDRLRKWEGRFSLGTAPFFAVAVVLFIADQVSKYWISIIMEYGETWPVVPEIFHLTYVRNFGAAFGILPFHRGFFIIVSILMIMLIIYGKRYFPRRYTFIRLGLAFQLGGALGNLYDRIRVGYVIDFLDFRFWPVFNLADAAIVVGAVFLILGISRRLSFFCLGK